MESVSAQDDTLRVGSYEIGKGVLRFFMEGQNDPLITAPILQRTERYLRQVYADREAMHHDDVLRSALYTALIVACCALLGENMDMAEK